MKEETKRGSDAPFFVAVLDEDTAKEAGWQYMMEAGILRCSVTGLKKKMRESEIENCYRSICSFEKQITEDGTLLIKLFLDIDQKEQKKRFDKLMESKRYGVACDKGSHDIILSNRLFYPFSKKLRNFLHSVTGLLNRLSEGIHTNTQLQ